MLLNPRTVAAVDSPIGLAYDLLDRRAGTRELLDLAQAAPQYPPAPEVVEAVVAAARHPRGGEYCEIAGLPGLRAAFAAEIAAAYAGEVQPGQVVVTAGCNQAFCLVASALAGPGDEIVVVLPYYFNHDMWLRMSGIVPVYLEPGPDLIPDPEAAAALITPRTRAVLLVTPGNPTGVTVPPARIAALAEVAARHGVALIVDETYRSFRDTDAPPHRLFADPDWPRTVVSLHSFSKDLAIPGYRVGAVIASAELGREVTKLLDCVAICAPRIGQEAALAGLTAAGAWRRARAADMADRRRWFTAALAGRPGGYEMLSAGGFFGWIRHPFGARPTEDVVRELVLTHDTLLIPGTAFLPQDRGTLRVSLSNADEAALTGLADRLAASAAGR
ncbi:aminotransferase [Nocardia sp. alder85J]|uniref:aminotransferase n=1 Tax=Nocardia sp. alder85J TaxID=2862949 RepID=UPI001CD4B843|nr:aminotransferase [Nocardia sp. alder85J]MCX4091637.1 aminotransferase [Nocardia sp. alder85J]